MGTKPIPLRGRSGLGPGDRKGLDVFVLHTTMAGTLAALRSAAELARDLRARIRLLVPRVIAYPVPLDEPPVRISHLVRQFRAISEQAAVETSIEIRLCRDPWDPIHQALTSRSIVVIGSRRRWWPTREEGIAKRLRAEGHLVVLTESK